MMASDRDGFRSWWLQIVMASDHAQQVNEFIGFIKDLAVFNRALSPEEVAANYNSSGITNNNGLTVRQVYTDNTYSKRHEKQHFKLVSSPFLHKIMRKYINIPSNTNKTITTSFYDIILLSFDCNMR